MGTAANRQVLSFEGRAGSLVGELVVPDASAGLVVLLHGGGQTRHSWGATAERLAEYGWSSLAYDARGHGDSDWATDSDYSINGYVDDLEAVLGDLRPAGGVALVGASLGGMTALVAQGENPALAQRLVLVDIVPNPQPEGVERIRRFMTANPAGFGSLDEAAAAIQAYNPSRPPPSNADGLRKNLRLREDGRWHWHWDPRILAFGSEPQPLLPPGRAESAAARIAIPTLLVAGRMSDVVRGEDLDAFQALIPGAVTTVVDGAGHMVAGDRNDAFAAAITAFFQ